MVHDNKMCGTTCRFKNWRKNMAIAKVQWSWKIDVKEKELVQRKQKLISTSTRCKSTSPYMTSQEVVLRLRAYNQKQNGALASKLWRLLFLLRKADRKFWRTVQFSVLLYLGIFGLSIRRIHIFCLYFFVNF